MVASYNTVHSDKGHEGSMNASLNTKTQFSQYSHALHRTGLNVNGDFNLLCVTILAILFT